MPKIPDEVVKRVIDRAKIEDVVGDFVTLRKAGVNLTGICPFHDDKHDGNFIVRPSTLSPGTAGRNTYHCFVCMSQGEGGGPVDFLMKAENMSFPDAIRYLGKKYSIDVDNIPLNWTPPPPRPVPPPPPPLAMERKWVKQLMGDYNRNPFTLWYGKLPWNDVQRRQMKRTLWQYCVGCWHDGRVVFWYIDHEGIPRSAKLMSYHNDGHREKERNPGWLYNQEGYRDICRPDEHTILKPLFGSHLLKAYPDASINVVESEKTALIMANYFGMPDSQLWLACGGLKFLKIESMQPLIDQGRKVWLWPDKDGVKGWQEVADKLGSDKVQVYTKFFDACWEPEDGDKADIADIAVRMLYHPEWVPREVKQQGATEPNATARLYHGVTLPPPPEGVTDAEWQEHLAILKQISDYDIIHPQDEPILDPEELRDPRLHQMREVLRHKFNFNKTKTNGKQKNKEDRFEQIGSKIDPAMAEVLNACCDALEVDIYHLIQWFCYVIVKASAPMHAIDPRIQKLMAMLDSDVGWQRAFNLANPDGLDVAQVILILEQKNHKGFGCVMIDKPFCGEPQRQTECVDDILERVTEVTMRGIYKRLRLMGAKMDCQNLSDVLLTMLDIQDFLDAVEGDAAEGPQMGDIAPNGKALAYGKRTKRKKHFTPDTMPVTGNLFDDIDHDAPLDEPLKDWEGEQHDK